MSHEVAITGNNIIDLGLNLVLRLKPKNCFHLTSLQKIIFGCTNYSALTDFPANPLPAWNGRQINAMNVGAAVVGLLVLRTAYSMLFGTKITQTTEEKCLNVMDYDIVCLDRTCEETSCGIFTRIWGCCIPKTECFPF